MMGKDGLRMEYRNPLINPDKRNEIDQHLTGIADDASNFLVNVLAGNPTHGINFGHVKNLFSDEGNRTVWETNGTVAHPAFEAVQTTPGFQAISRAVEEQYRVRMGLDSSDGFPTDLYVVFEKHGSPHTFTHSGRFIPLRR
jgi:hypothetical protein